MKQFYLILICFTGLMAQAFGTEFNPYEGHKPLVVMLEVNAWGSGADTPSFVLYEDGQVIYIRRTAKNHGT